MRCAICNAGNAETRIINKNGTYYCRKHYLQIYRYGKIIERTIYDSNDFIIKGDTTEIVLYDKYGSVTGFAQIDTEDLERCKIHKWYLSKTNTTGYVRTSIQGKKVCLHSFILNDIKDKYIDHIDGDGTNNRKDNLRICTNAENSRNRHSPNVIGVRFDMERNKWCASITVNYRRKFLGRYINYEDAIFARIEAEKKYFGEFAPQIHQ